MQRFCCAVWLCVVSFFSLLFWFCSSSGVSVCLIDIVVVSAVVRWRFAMRIVRGVQDNGRRMGGSSERTFSHDDIIAGSCDRVTTEHF